MDFDKDKLTLHEQFDKLIDEYYPDLKDEKKTKLEKKCQKTEDFFFKSVDRSKKDYARIDENDEPPNFTDLVPNETKIGTLKMTDPLPKIEKRNKLKDDYLKWLKTEKLMLPKERKLEYENMQKAYLETLKLSQEIKNDVKFNKIIKAHYPRGVVGVDSIYNEKTELYKDKYKELQKKKEIKEIKMNERRKILDKYNNSNLTFNEK